MTARLILICVLAITCATASTWLVAAQDDAGRLDVIVTDEVGEAMNVIVDVLRGGREVGSHFTDVGAGGLAVFPGLRPGAHEVLVKVYGNTRDGYRPQQVFSPVIKAGARTLVRARMSRGIGIEQLGKATAPDLGSIGNGRLDVIVTNESGKAMNVIVDVLRGGREVGSRFTDVGAGGLAIFPDLKSGSYEVLVKTYGNTAKGYRPQQIFAVGVRGRNRTIVRTKMSTGQGTEEIDYLQPILEEASVASG